MHLSNHYTSSMHWSGSVCVCVCMRVCVRACVVCACMRVCACVCVCRLLVQHKPHTTLLPVKESRILSLVITCGGWGEEFCKHFFLLASVLVYSGGLGLVVYTEAIRIFSGCWIIECFCYGNIFKWCTVVRVCVIEHIILFNERLIPLFGDSSLLTLTLGSASRCQKHFSAQRLSWETRPSVSLWEPNQWCSTFLQEITAGENQLHVPVIALQDNHDNAL